MLREALRNRSRLVRALLAACRGEDVKLIGEYGVGWCAYVFLDDTSDGVPLHEGSLPERPEYKWIETQINEQFPQPRWARQLNKVDEQGLRFMRGGGDGDVEAGKD